MKSGVLATCVVIVGLFAACDSMVAQVVARQATPAEDPKQYFDSPMVLELPFPDIRQESRIFALSRGTEIRNYVCDDVTLHHLAIDRGKTKGKGDKARVPFEYTGVITVGSTRDKEVVVRFTIMKGEMSISNIATQRMEVEEGRSKAIRLKLQMPEAKLLSLYEGEPAPQLHIMLTVWDD